MKRFISSVTVFAVLALATPGWAAGGNPKPSKTEAVMLTEAGEKLHSRYAEMLSGLQAEIAKVIPVVDENMKTAFLAAREAVKKAKVAVKAAQDPLDKIQSAKALVEHANGKWIGGAKKEIAQAQELLKKATTEAEQEAAKKALAKGEEGLQAGLKALAERQAALDVVTANEEKNLQASKEAKAALDEAEANELQSAKAIVSALDGLLSSDNLDAKLVKCVVLVNATARGLAEFAQQGAVQEELVEKLLANTTLMKDMLDAGGANGGKYGRAMQIYTDIQNASKKAGEGILYRLAIGTSVEHAVPVGRRNAIADTTAPATVDPVNRYLHYEKAYLDGELDPAFKNMSSWECRQIVNSYAPDHVLAWGREMLRNYRPDHIYASEYGWRYSGIVRTDVAYRHSQEYKDTDSLDFFHNVIKNGGICGRRAFFGVFIVRCFGLPSVERPQRAHAALARWTPKGWVVNLGAGWGYRDAKGLIGMNDANFLLETQMQKYPAEKLKALRAQWIADILGEQKYDSFKDNGGGLWNIISLFQKKAIVAQAKQIELAALGTELGEANESAETKAKAVETIMVMDTDKKIVTAENGVITIPAVACKGDLQSMKSFLGGLQAYCGGAFDCAVAVTSPGKYQLTAQIVSVHDEGKQQLVVNNSKDPVTLVIPFTCGKWEPTQPVEVTLVQGNNSLSFAKPERGFALKYITLTPVK